MSTHPRLPLPVLDLPANPALEPARRGYRDRILFVYPAGATYALRHAQPADAPAIHALLETYVAEGRVLPRTIDQVYRTIRDFIVAVDGERIVGCGALRIYSDGLAEVGALAVARDWHGRGVGRRIVEALKLEARILGIRRVFALTLEDAFFHRLGFGTVTIAEFPEKIARDCASCSRRSGCMEIAVAHDVQYDVHDTRRV